MIGFRDVFEKPHHDVPPLKPGVTCTWFSRTAPPRAPPSRAVHAYVLRVLRVLHLLHLLHP